MGGKTISTADKRVASIQIQTSAYGLAIPVVFGTARVSANLVWFGNFTATPHTTSQASGGKGLGKVTSKNTTYTYSAAAILAIAEGPIAGVGKVWRDKDQTTLGALSLTVATGTATQGVWAFLAGYNISANWYQDSAYGYSSTSPAFTDQAINYSSTAYLYSSAYDLGADAGVPNHGFEVQGFNIVGTGGVVDANPADIITGILTSQQYGMGFAGAQVDALASYRTYCTASGLFMSPAYITQSPAAQSIQQMCDATNSEPLWSGGILKVIPYGDATITANGATYTPNIAPLFDLADDDFQDADEPIRVTRITPADAYNRVSIQFNNRANSYNPEVASAEDQDAIEKYGLKPASTQTMDFICNSGTAKFVAQLGLQRLLYKRNTYEFDLDARYPMLEPMDIVTLTDAALGMSKLPVRITMIAESDHGFTITAEDLPVGVASAARYIHDDGLHWQSVINQTPQNAQAPIIFELPADPSATGLSVGLATGGLTTDPLYGGCRVWLSLDGTNYKAEGIIYGSSRYGTTTAALAAAPRGTDTTNTLALALRANGQMQSASTTDRDKGTTLLNVGGEYLAYATATLTSVNNYNLTSLNRGLYGTASGLHASGAAWVRVDDAIAILKDLDLTLIGQTIYIKLTAFNTYQTGEQDLSAVSAYTYTITGNMKALETPLDFANVGGTTKPENNATVGGRLGTNIRDSGSNLLQDYQVKNTDLSNNNLRIPAPVGGSYNYTNPITGILKITLPTIRSSTMLQFKVDIYQFTSDQMATYSIGGYPYDTGTATDNNNTHEFWSNCSANVIGTNDAVSLPVRWGNDGTHSCVWIGDTTTVWSYPSVRVYDFSGGFGTTVAASWETGWSVGISTAASTNVVVYRASTFAGMAKLGRNLIDSSAVVQSDANLKNSALTLSAGGVFSGGGGGSITALPADYLIDGSTYGRYALTERTKLGGVDTGATLGARLGFNVRDGAANTLMNDSDLKNSAISISAAGALSGAGGGSITALPADYLIDGSTYGRYALSERTKLGGVDTGATLGGRFGYNLRDGGANALLNDSDVKNSAITMGSGGALGGAGGGSITALDFTNVAGATKPQNNADVTANSQILATVATMMNIPATYTGAIASGTLPAHPIDPVVTLGGVDKTHDNLTTYSIVNTTGGCVGNMTVDNGTGSATKGRQTIGTGFTASGGYQLQVTYNGVNLPLVTVTVTVTKGAAPTSGGTGGSFDLTGKSVGSGGFAESARVSGITVAAGKTVYGYFSGDYDYPGTPGSRSVQGKWQYTAAGGTSWTDFAAYVQGSAAAADYGSVGSITCNQTAASLAAGSYDIRFVTNLSNTGSVTWSSGSGSVSIS
jgi:hypothetical protein